MAWVLQSVEKRHARLRFRGPGLFLTACMIYSCSPMGVFGDESASKRAITVEDIIQMKRLAIPDSFTSGSADTINRAGLTAQFSPDGARFTVLLRSGDLRNNRNNYSLLLFETSRLFRSAKPEFLLTMSSSSNRAAIKGIKWLGDSERIAFLGEGPGELPQVYLFNVLTKRLQKMTHHATPVVAYDIDQRGRTIVFEADPSPALPSREIERRGIVVTTQGMDELLAERRGPYVPSWTLAEELFVKASGKPEERIRLTNLAIGNLPPLVSPDGRYALQSVLVRKAPAAWSEYNDEQIQKEIQQNQQNEIASAIRQYMLLDTTTGKIAPLLNSPSGWQTAAACWAPDGDSVVLSGTYLPLDTTEGERRLARIAKTYVVEVKVPSKRIVEITDEKASILRWVRRTNRIILEKRGQALPGTSPLAFEREGETWKEVTEDRSGRGELKRLDVRLKEDLTSRPRIVVTNPATERETLLMDLNPELDKLEIGSAKQVKWQATDGHWVEGALFLPPSYTPEKRYPLVIQTHGFVKDKFYLDGPWSSAFAARPLACKNIVVLQVGYSVDNDDAQYLNTPREGPRAMAVLEGAVDFLDATETIDRNRVGIIAFSRTVFGVSYALTHSAYHFAAVTLADGFDAGYLQYLAYPQSPLGDAVYVNGGIPAGDSLLLWFRDSPDFNLDKVKSAVRIEAYGRMSLVSGWERFSMLSHLGRPVDYIYIPGGVHILAKPWDRKVSQQGNVDWFAFWLNDEVDGNPEKRAQYERWIRLRSRSSTSIGDK
jgi:dipeptidyl aminopeptidase/acylaminoacyl peptidase